MIIKNNKDWFTFIELVVVITIVSILMLMSYAPYSFYNKKAQLKISAKQVSKILYETRNLAIHWLSSWTWNVSVWVYFDSSDINKNSMKIFTYPIDYTSSQIIIDSWNPDIKILRELNLQKYVEIDSIWWQSNWLFFFEAITWKWEFSYFDTSKHIFSLKEIPIKISYADNNLLKKEIIYVTETNIVD